MMAQGSKADEDEITVLLHRASNGDGEAEGELIPLIYRELRKKAHALRAKERRDHTLEATEIVHEAYVQLMRGTPVMFADRIHFFRTAAQVMRRILVDHARKRRTRRRKAMTESVPLEENMLVREEEADQILEIDEALERLRAVAQRPALVVELRFFTGLTEEEISDCLQVSSKTVKRDWKFAQEYFRGTLAG